MLNYDIFEMSVYHTLFSISIAMIIFLRYIYGLLSGHSA